MHEGNEYEAVREGNTYARVDRSPRTKDSSNPDTMNSPIQRQNKPLSDVRSRLGAARDQLFGAVPTPGDGRVKNPGNNLAELLQTNEAEIDSIAVEINELLSRIGV